MSKPVAEFHTDVVIVGAGPSGSVCALMLARAGISVTIIERAEFPRRKVCGEYLNCGVIDILREIDCYDEIAVHAHALQGVDLHTGGVVGAFDFPQSALGIPRAMLDSILYNAAVRAGARHIRGRVTDVRITDGRIDGVWLDGPEGVASLHARIVVGADGCGSIIARKMGVAGERHAPGRFAMGGHFRSTSAARLAMFVQNGAYLAINPLDNEHANVMLVMPKKAFAACGADADAWFARTASAMTGGLMSADAFTADRRVGTRVSVGPLLHRVRTAVAPGALLVGDAAGFLSPFTGQGVFLALRSACSAARAIIAAFAQPSTARQNYAAYDAAQRGDRRSRAMLSGYLDTLGRMPAIARIVLRHVAENASARERLLSMFCGLTPPSVTLGARALIPFLSRE